MPGFQCLSSQILQCLIQLHSPCGPSLTEDTKEVSLCLATYFHKNLKITFDFSYNTKYMHCAR